MRRLMCLIIVVCLLSLANSASASTSYYWHGTSSDWNVPGNWTSSYTSTGTPFVTSYPGSAAANEDKPYIQVEADSNFTPLVAITWPILDTYIDLGGTDNTVDAGKLTICENSVTGGYFVGKLTIGPDGYLITEKVLMARTEKATTDCYAELNINGGTIICEDGDIEIGRAGHGVINMTGGLLQSTGMDLRMTDFVASVAEVNISGGLIDVAGINLGDGTASIKVSETGVIKFEDDVQDLIDDGTIVQLPDDGALGLRYWEEGGYYYVASLYSPFHPVPKDTAYVLPGARNLEWDLPDPNTPGETVTCDVYFSSDPNLFASSKIVDNEAVEVKAVVPAVSTRYYWRIDVRNDGVLIPYLSSRVFSFSTENSPPLIDAGNDVETWLVSGSRVVQLDGFASDTDGMIQALTYEWTVVSEPGGTAAVISDSDILDPTVTLGEAGTYVLQLEVDDGEYAPTDTMQIIVYADACDHAKAQTGFVPLEADIDDDCDVDLSDFAIMANSWLAENFSI